MKISRLVEIPCEKWPQLRDMYLKDWPMHHAGYYTVDNYIKWIQRDPNIKNLKFYSLDGVWTDGTFLAIDRYQLFINTLNPSIERLETALNLLDWKNGYKVSSFLHRHRPAVLNVVESKNLKKEYDCPTVLYYLPKSEAKNLDLRHSDEYILKPLTEEEAETVNDLWPNKHHASLFFIKRVINWNPNIGIYTKDGLLVAWCLRSQVGQLGTLQVKKEYQKRGLGSLAVKAMVKKLAEIGHDTFALVNVQNEPSRKVFENLGFIAFDKAYWLRTYPLHKYEWSDE